MQGGLLTQRPCDAIRKTGRPTFEKSFRNSGEASACSSKQRPSSGSSNAGRTSSQLASDFSIHVMRPPSPQISAVGPDLRRSVRSIWPCRYRVLVITNLGGTQRVEADTITIASFDESCMTSPGVRRGQDVSWRLTIKCPSQGLMRCRHSFSWRAVRSRSPAHPRRA